MAFPMGQQISRSALLSVCEESMGFESYLDLHSYRHMYIQLFALQILKSSPHFLYVKFKGQKFSAALFLFPLI